MLLDGVGMDAVVELGEGTVEFPREGEAAVFVVLEALEFLDEVEFELQESQERELESDVLVGIRAAVAAGLEMSLWPRSSQSTAWSEGEAVQARLDCNSVEFDGIKTRVVELFPDAEELDGIAVSKPIPHEIITSLGILVTSDVREGGNPPPSGKEW